MPPKNKFTKEEITAAAVEVVRRFGAQGLTARSLAAELGCSPKPIFGLFENMEEVQKSVADAAAKIFREKTEEEIRRGKYPVYKCTGMAYVRFAKEEKELFKLLYMKDRDGKPDESGEDLEKIVDIVRENTGLSGENAYMFHIETWIYVHGIAAMIATGFLDWDMDFVSGAVTDCYMGLRERFEKKENTDNDMGK